MDWIDVIDSAVKIGLGGLIAGSFAYGIARFNHKREEIQRVLARREKFLDDILAALHDFHRAYKLYYARRYDASNLASSGKASSSEEVEELVQLHDKLTDIFTNLVEVESNVLVLGVTTLHTRVLEYMRIVEKFQWEYDPDNRNVTTDQITVLNKQIEEVREQLLRDLGKVYGVQR